MFIFDGDNRKIHIDPAFVVDGYVEFTCAQIWSRWCDWNATTSGIYPRAFDMLMVPNPAGGYIGPFLFMRNDLGWRGVPPPIDGVQIRCTGGAFYGKSGSLPLMDNLVGQETDFTIEQSNIVNTISTSGSTGPTAAEIAAAVWAYTRP